MGFCVHDMQGNESPRTVTGDIIYVRFHGTSGRYAYFNNDIQGHAVNNANTLKEMMGPAALKARRGD